MYISSYQYQTTKSCVYIWSTSLKKKTKINSKNKDKNIYIIQLYDIKDRKKILINKINFCLISENVYSEIAKEDTK